MKTLARGLALTFLLLCVIAAVAGVALSRWFNPEDYRDTLRQWVLDRSGLQLEWQAPMRWSLFPALGVELQNVTLTPLASAAPLASARRVAISVQAWPLLWREIDVRLLDAEGVTLTLQRDNNGRGNWESLLSSIHPVTLADSTPPSETPLPTSAWKLSVAGISLQNSALTYQEAATGRRFSLNQIDLKTQHLFENKAIPFTLRAQAEGGPWPWQWAGEVEGSLRFERAAQRYQVEGMRLKGTLTGEPVPNASLAFEARGDVIADVAAHTWTWHHARLEANRLNMLGELQGTWGQRVQLTGGVSVATFDARTFMASIGRPLPAALPETAFRQVALASKIDVKSDSIRLEDLRLHADEGRLNGLLVYTPAHAQQVARVEGSLNATVLDMDAWLPVVTLLQPAETPHPDAILLSEMGLGDTPLPALPTLPAWNSVAQLPVSVLRALDLQLSLTAERLRWRRWPLEEVSAQLIISKGVLSFNDVKARLFAGHLSASAQLDGRTEPAQWQLDINADQIPVERLLSTGNASELPALTGALNLQAALRARGDVAQEIVDTLSGEAHLRLNNGSLLGVNVEQPLCRAIAAYRQQVPTFIVTTRNRPLSELTTHFILNDGVARSTLLQARLPGLSLRGDGAVYLRNLGLEYQLRVRLAEDWAMSDPACQLDRQTALMQWPLQCRGPLQLGVRTCRAAQ